MRTSALLEQMATQHQDEAITMGEVFDRLADRGMGIIILLFALPNCIPFFGIPGVSSITGLPIILVAFEKIMGRNTLYLPARLRDKRISASGLAKVIRITVPCLRWCETILRERAYSLFDRGERIVGLVLLILAVILALPLPLLNFIPAVCIAIIALGLIERDGYALALGMVTFSLVLYAKYQIILALITALI